MSTTTLWSGACSLSLRQPFRRSLITVSTSAIWQGIGLLGPRGVATDLWDSILKAVPKKKTTHSKTRMRSATKGLKDRTDINNCSACGKPKLAHTICLDCFTSIRRRWNGKGEVEA